ncbi:hypothetical protein DICPUDRAFT_158996 [Dictyostelium purpureum]|uniref:Uncharacterized protein n=1 Tax=Dictyostelium purpureum TaxID=5786 RepID=F1A304_DICPU|nr:uncharacterized protein DICPUDRAFT_158996 [Dictyostelium purpureum]EGC29423.1 hypothetical protein DICPUDRAFT_158996 [Dictyostelium purpureum]|eukprot:XP_003294048.1 hypothetical protein DICPUDRAFT_158996 [Dictyostelium purpureum]
MKNKQLLKIKEYKKSNKYWLEKSELNDDLEYENDSIFFSKSKSLKRKKEKSYENDNLPKYSPDKPYYEIFVDEVVTKTIYVTDFDICCCDINKKSYYKIPLTIGKFSIIDLFDAPDEEVVLKPPKPATPVSPSSTDNNYNQDIKKKKNKERSIIDSEHKLISADSTPQSSPSNSAPQKIT